MAFEVRQMTSADLQRALDWAADEGWNPGEGDAEAFYAADPGGFLMGWLDGTPITAISVVRYGSRQAFLGLYLCRPEYRGRGFGIATWRAGLAMLGGRAVGLDGVVAQQANYQRAGFEPRYRNLRMVGVCPARPTTALALDEAALGAALALDRAATGFERGDFMAAWLHGGPGRQSATVQTDGDLRAVGTIRRCRSGFKVGPLFAKELQPALDVLSALGAQCDGAQVSIDVPEFQTEFLAALRSFGFEQSFEAARMVKGTAPEADPRLIYGQTTLELG